MRHMAQRYGTDHWVRVAERCLPLPTPRPELGNFCRLPFCPAKVRKKREWTDVCAVFRPPKAKFSTKTTRKVAPSLERSETRRMPSAGAGSVPGPKAQQSGESSVPPAVSTVFAVDAQLDARASGEPTKGAQVPTFRFEGSTCPILRPRGGWGILEEDPLGGKRGQTGR